jgi:hypothetical protein
LVTEVLRHARLTLLDGAAGCGKTALDRDVVMSGSRKTSDVALLFDS